MQTIDTRPQLDSGLDPARTRAGYFQFKKDGPFYRLRSFNFEPGADADQAKFNEHRHDGTNRPDSFAMVGLDSLWSGAFSPYYSELPVIHRNLYGTPVVSERIDENYSPDPNGSLRREVFHLAARGGNNRHLWRAQFGEVLYGRFKLRSYSGDIMRNGDGGGFSGNATAHCNDILDYDAPIPGSVAQNAKYTIAAANVSGPLVLGYKLPGSNTTRSVTMAIGDTALQTKAKFEAFGDGVTVNVVGNIAAAGTNEVQSVNAPGVDAVVINAQPGGTQQTINATDDVTTKRNKLALAWNKTAGHIVVTDSSTAPIEGTTTFDFDPQGFGHSGPYTSNGVIVNGAPQFVNSFAGVFIEFDGTKWVCRFSAGAVANFAAGTAQGGPPLGTWTGGDGYGDKVLSNKVTTPGTPGTVAFTATFSGASVAGINQPQMTSPTQGVTISTIVQGSNTSGGAVAIEFTSPANARVTVSKVSGHAGYVLTETQTGTDGSGPLFIGGTDGNPAPVESDSVVLLMADSWEQLEAINLDDENAEEIMLGVLGHTWSSGDNSNGVWTLNRSVAPSNWVSVAEEIALGVIVWKGPQSEALRALQDGCTTGKKYIREHYKCGLWQWIKDGVYSRHEPIGKGNENDLPTRTVPFLLMNDNISSYRVTIIGPNAEYFIP